MYILRERREPVMVANMREKAGIKCRRPADRFEMVVRWRKSGISYLIKESTLLAYQIKRCPVRA